MKYEYQIIYIYETESKEEIIKRFNDLGKDGWRFITVLPETNEYLFVREILENGKK